VRVFKPPLCFALPGPTTLRRLPRALLDRGLLGPPLALSRLVRACGRLVLAILRFAIVRK
jgi:hypothetical protein